MRIALIAAVFPPLRISSAVQIRDLSHEFAQQGHSPTVLVPAPGLDAPWRIEYWEGVRVVRLRSPETRDIGYARRAIGELLLPFVMLFNLRKSPVYKERWDGVVWYSPPIFLGPLVSILKRRSACSSYLILRDIFPEWAVNLGLMRRGLAYRLFKMIERYQYSIATAIGVQSPANLEYFKRLGLPSSTKVEVLENWLKDDPNVGCSIAISDTHLSGRMNFVYAGNMGVAQGIGLLVEIAESFRQRHDVGFVFVGRGSEANRLRSECAARRLDNVVFFDEIDPSEIPGLYAQCHVGIVTLDSRHKTHNIPGKFLSYMRAGLPVLACVNPGNDLVDLIDRERVGRVSVDQSVDTLRQHAEALIDIADEGMRSRCRALAYRLYAPSVAVEQIVNTIGAPRRKGSEQVTRIRSGSEENV